ncbi:MAG TPA: hypothetical protein DEF43_20385 [Chloroflexus aurantiacus]|uniref:CRISPR type III-associated protein domain-containing protein n=1 Tax=Chloroflexus aurantiacus (strain ATCC 29366 / DSM 635 / J-10-fl) TaxID=324602 RepID=A9WGH5_CHLAA|nr:MULTISPECIES: RAMP superfamily CRISPR-associated protein [Chloroflexus]ABY35507.1 protein of unknown function DUF324 [Chloroflexus aurantiacus J-10-fl]GIV92049.1 MAG: hypothetical protein KatS3mg056_0758 [Chloroflexus sp.]HBW69460.1 hypothetical protein [Chloroflexus aurantiacus]
MARQKVSVEPKPFFWVPLDKERPPQKYEPPTHESYRDWSGRLKLELEVVSDYLFVGSGEFGLFTLQGCERSYYAFARRNDQLIIPGTGIKGAVRSVVEAISNSCVRQIAKGERVPQLHEGCKNENSLCPACRLFGSTGHRGRVHFSDAVLLSQVEPTKIKIADLWPPRQTKGRKFYQAKQFQPLDMQPKKNHRFLEVVPKGTRFQTTLYFENTTAAEMGIMMRAIGLDGDQGDAVVSAFPIKLGGAKPRCLGAVRWKLVGLHLITPSSNLLAALSTGGEQMPISDSVRTWLADHTLLNDKAWTKFRDQARSLNEPCPREVY